MRSVAPDVALRTNASHPLRMATVVGREGLTIQEACDLINTSSEYLVRALESETIAHTGSGDHRRLQLEDVLAYKRRRDADRSAALDELTELSEELGYSELMKSPP